MIWPLTEVGVFLMGGRYVLADTRHTSDYESIRIISRYDLVDGVYSRSDNFILILKPTFNTCILCQILHFVQE